MELGNIYNVDYETIRTRLVKNNIPIRRSSNYSLQEVEIRKFLDENNIEHITNSYDIIPYELDIYIPKYKFAIEHNGNFFHSSFSKESEKLLRNKHLNKTLECNNLGISLFHIRGDQWQNRKDIIKSMILNKCGLSKRIYARKCEIQHINKNVAMEFIEENHIQGTLKSSKYNIGLIYENELVSLISIGNPRYNKNYDLELLRSVTKKNLIVVGGFSKLIKYFRSINNESLVSYCDRQYSTGISYYKAGFILHHISQIGYCYTDKRYNIYHRTEFMKSKLKHKLEIFDENLSESENMYNNGYRKMFDCGEIVFELPKL